MARDSSTPVRTPSNGAIFTVLYLALLILAYLLMRQPPVTGEFPDTVARRFNVLVTGGGDGGAFPRSTSLYALRQRGAGTSGLRFRLSTPTVQRNGSDPVTVSVMESNEQWQLLRYHYSNTHTSISIYRAYDDHVEPVSFQTTSHVGMGFAAVALFFVAGIASVIIGGAWRWHARRKRRRS